MSYGDYEFPIVDIADVGEGIHVIVNYEQHDQEYADPRDCDNLGVMFCDYKGYNLGDADASDYDPRGRTIECPECKGSGENERRFNVYEVRGYGREVVKTFKREAAANAFVNARGDNFDIGHPDCERCEGTCEVEVGMFEYLQREHGARVVLPLFVYEHSGITMSAGENMGSINPRGRNPFDGDAWDTSMVGFIFDTEDSRKMCGCEDFTPERIEEGLRAEVELYDEYLRGEVFWYAVVDDAECERDEDGDLVYEDLRDAEVLDTCGGFVGDGAKAAMEEGKGIAEHYVEERRKVRQRNELVLSNWRD